MERNFRYKYVIDEKNRIIVAISSFAGRTVRGVARCSPEDTFNVETGKKLAEARCSMKIAQKRLQRATLMLHCAKQGLEYYTNTYEKYRKYELDANEGVKIATEELKKLEENI